MTTETRQEEIEAKIDDSLRPLAIGVLVFSVLMIASCSGVWWCCASLFGAALFGIMDNRFGIAGAVGCVALFSFLAWAFREAWLPILWTAIGKSERVEAKP